MTSHLPEDHKTYNFKVYKRCLEKIRTTNCWMGIDTITLDNWLSNFETEEEKFLAHRILDLLIYRSDPQIYSLLQTFFYQTIPSVLHKNGYDLDEIKELISRLNNHRGRLKIALNLGRNDFTGSATEIGRRIKTRFWVNERNLVDLSKIKRMPQDCVIIIIDDFCGTGNQVTKELVRNITQRNREIYLCPLIMHSSAIKQINEKLVAKNIIKDFEATEYIDDRYNIFSSNSKCFKWRDGIFNKEYKKVYENLAHRKMPSLKEDDKYGYESQSLIISFHYRCPNNCIPLIWYANDGWSPLIRR